MMNYPKNDRKHISYLFDYIRQMALLVRRYGVVDWDFQREQYVFDAPSSVSIVRENGGLKSITVKVDFAPGHFPERERQTIACLSHGEHPHGGSRCLDCTACVVGVGPRVLPSDAEWVAWFLGLSKTEQRSAASRIIESEVLRSLPGE